MNVDESFNLSLMIFTFHSYANFTQLGINDQNITSNS